MSLSIHSQQHESYAPSECSFVSNTSMVWLLCIVQTQEFEVSCSQETRQHDDSVVDDSQARKKRKASIASRSIMV